MHIPACHYRTRWRWLYCLSHACEKLDGIRKKINHNTKYKEPRLWAEHSTGHDSDLSKLVLHELLQSFKEQWIYLPFPNRYIHVHIQNCITCQLLSIREFINVDKRSIYIPDTWIKTTSHESLNVSTKLNTEKVSFTVLKVKNIFYPLVFSVSTFGNGSSTIVKGSESCNLPNLYSCLARYVIQNLSYSESKICHFFP